MERDTRRALLLSLVLWNRPLSEVRRELQGFSWDWDEAPLVTLTAQDIVAVLERFKSGEVDPAGVEEWANLLEGRDDVQIDPGMADVVAAAIHDLANPILQGELWGICHDVVCRLQVV